ncbi:Trm112 family protein [Streptomyces sp. NPDC093589]|uniref:Trm112 family protein n=1 Tax=Streptomyces sp. NPDC093589 TaxID=3366043 RepID=UPI00382EC0C9
MTPDDPLLKILACPLDKGPLTLLAPEDALYNPRMRRRYPLLDGIPQLLPSSGEQVTDAEHDRILRRLTDTGQAGSPPPEEPAAGPPGQGAAGPDRPAGQEPRS